MANEPGRKSPNGPISTEIIFENDQVRAWDMGVTRRWKKAPLCGWSAEIVSIVVDEAFYELDGPPVRITTPHIPLPAADILEDIALPTADRIVERVRRSLES